MLLLCIVYCNEGGLVDAFTISESDKILIDADDQDLSLLLKQLAQQLSPFGSNGVEDENIEEESEEMEPFNPEEISIDPKVVPMDALLRRLVQKTIILNPDFQRNEVWDNVQKSRLIESLMLKILRFTSSGVPGLTTVNLNSVS